MKFAVSLVNKTTGESIKDFAVSELKTPKGAARNSLATVGHFALSQIKTGPLHEIFAVVRPIISKMDASFAVGLNRAQYRELEEIGFWLPINEL